MVIVDVTQLHIIHMIFFSCYKFFFISLKVSHQHPVLKYPETTFFSLRDVQM